MKNTITLINTLLTFFIFALVTANNFVYEYGKDAVGVKRFVDHIAGEIGPDEQEKRVFLNLPPCRTVEYVRIELDNPLSVPRVAFDRDTRSVIITYAERQFSESTYTIQVKSSRASGCRNKLDPDYYDVTRMSRIAMDYYGY